MHSKIRVSAVAALIMSAALIGGCTVRPMLATTTTTDLGTSERAQLSSINVAQVSTRPAQEVRNHLIFLLHGGAAQPTQGKYRLDLAVSKRVLSTVQVQANDGTNDPTAGTVQLTGKYSLVETATGTVVARGTQQMSASFDRPLQEFAVLRAELDAENRAARELAEFIRLSLAQDLVRASQ